MSEKTKEIVIAVSILIFGLVTLFYLIPTQVKVAEGLEIKSLSPAFFPELAAVLIIFLSVVLIFTRFIHRTDREDSDGSREPSRSEMTAREEFRVLGAFLIAALYYFGFKYFGFLITTAVCLAGMFLLQGGKKAHRIALLSITVTLGLFAFFHYVMKVYFPVGVIFR